MFNFLAIFSLRFMTEKEGFHIFSSFFIILDQYILGRPLDLLDIASESGCYLFPTGGKKYPQRSHAQPILEKCYQVNHKHFLHLKISNSIFARRQAYTARTLAHTPHSYIPHTCNCIDENVIYSNQQPICVWPRWWCGCGCVGVGIRMRMRMRMPIRIRSFRFWGFSLRCVCHHINYTQEHANLFAKCLHCQFKERGCEVSGTTESTLEAFRSTGGIT